MNADQALVIDDSEEGITVESAHAQGLVYVFKKPLRHKQPRIGISCLDGITYAEPQHARAIVLELLDMIETYC